MLETYKIAITCSTLMMYYAILRYSSMYYCKQAKQSVKQRQHLTLPLLRISKLAIICFGHIEYIHT